MDIYINHQSISNYMIVLEKQSVDGEAYAISELIKYINIITGHILTFSKEKSMGNNICFVYDKKSDLTSEGFEITKIENNIEIKYLGGRGCIYAVYTFLEKVCGYRFYTDELAFRGLESGTWMKKVEGIQNNEDVYVDDNLHIKEVPVFYLRDASTPYLRREEWAIKKKINGETWNKKYFEDFMGGGNDVRFAGSGGGGHTFRLLVPIEEYGQSHPEYYAMIGRKRITTYTNSLDYPQLCMMNEDIVQVISNKIRKYLSLKSDARMVSVSVNDSLLFCECEKCKKSYSKYGKFGTVINLCNKVAKSLESEYPNVLIHTFAYNQTEDINSSIKAHKNIIVQYCPTKMCRCHALDDPNCPINSIIYSRLKTLAKVTDNILIYDYRQCLKYSLFTLPDIFTLRETMRVYAENNVKGVYSEMCLHASNEPTFEELRAYLFSKLVWEPYMSKEEYDYHINDFLKGYYGKNWIFIKEFLVKYSEFGKDKHTTGFGSPMIDDNMQYVKNDKGEVVFADIIPHDKIKEFCDYANSLFDKAKEDVTPAQKERIEMVRTTILWYELFHTMDNILTSGSEEEKQKIILKNRDLCSHMRKYAMKLTTYIGMTSQDRMFDDFSISPSKWPYKETIVGDAPKI